MSSKKKILENSMFYIFSSLLVRALGFLLLPIYTLFLTPDDYGITNLVSGFLNVGIFIIAFSLYSAAIRFYADYKDDLERLKKFYSSLINFIIISGFFSVVIGTYLREFLQSIFFDGIEFYPIILISLFTLTFFSLHTMHQSMLQGMQKGKKLTIINITVFLITVGLKLVFLGVLHLGVVGFLLAQLIVYVSYSIFIIYDLKREGLYCISVDIKMLKEALKYSIPLIPHNLSTRLASLISRIFINNTGTLAAVGLYSIGMQFGNLIDVVQTSVNKAFQPWFYESMNKNDSHSRKDAVSLANFLLIFYSLIYMLIGLFSQEIVILMTNESYVMAWTVIPILVVGFSIKSIYYFFVNIVMYYKEAANKLFLSTITGSLFDILFSYLLIPKYGMYGAAMAFVLGKIIVVLIVVIISRQFDDIGYKVSKMLTIILPSLTFMAIGLYFSYTNFTTEFNILNFLYKLFVLSMYILYIFFTNKKIIVHIIRNSNINKYIRR